MEREQQVNVFIGKYVNDFKRGSESYETYAGMDEIAAACRASIRWADETMLEWVKSWLAEHINDYIVNGRVIDLIFGDLQSAYEEKLK